MLKNIKFYMFSASTMRFQEVKHVRTAVVLSGVAVALIATGIIYVINNVAGDFLGMGSDRVTILASENRILRDQVKSLTNKFEDVQESLNGLADRGNELRLMVDLRKIDDDTRLASVGGTVRRPEFSFLTGEAKDALERADRTIEQLIREVKLQQASYEEIHRRYEFNQKYFTHLPAIKPMAGYYSINGFGMRVHPVLRVYRMHEGLDIINDVGTSVYASADGVVRYSGRTQGGYGTVIEISHGYGYSTLYAHLSQVMVKPGQTVRRGELIGKSGRSGLVSGPHLHYEVRYNGRKQNPVDYFFDDVNAARYRTLLASAR